MLSAPHLSRSVEIVPQSSEPIVQEIIDEKPATKEDIEAYIRDVFAEDPDMAVAIAFCESGLREDAYNPEWNARNKGITSYGSCGIMQINHPSCEFETSPLYDYKANIDFAYHEKYATQGWQPWMCRHKV